jgi:hypothetical protein
VRDALGSTARAVVVESELTERPRGEFVEASDLLVLVLLNGRERTRPQFESLFSDSGLRIESRVSLMTGFTAFVLATDGP